MWAFPAGNAWKLLTPFASVSTGHTCLPGDREMAALFWGPAGYPVTTQAFYHLELRDNTGRYQTVLAWVVREDSSEELSKSLSEVEEGAVQASRGRASCADRRSSDVPESGASLGCWTETKKSTPAGREQEEGNLVKNNSSKFGKTTRPDNVEEGRFYSKQKTIL